MKKLLLLSILTLFILTACDSFHPTYTDEEWMKHELKKLLTEQAEISGQIKAKVDTINNFKQVDQLFSPNAQQPVRKTVPKTPNIPGPEVVNPNPPSTPSK